MQDLLTWRATGRINDGSVKRPRALTKQEWPPNYDSIYRWRIQMLQRLNSDPSLVAASKKYYSTRPVEFIMDWMDTYDPRNAQRKWMPFVLFEKQVQLVEFLQGLSNDQQSGLIEKARDMGATWVCCAYSIWRWLFIPNDAIGWGSRKESLVDKLGEPDSLFEKMRLLLKRLPPCFHPIGFNAARHSTFMKLTNPENGAIISGESGDNIGRGGRKSCFFKDEAAHYERPEKIEAALGDNTNVQIDISSVNGLGNVFHRRAENATVWQPGAVIPSGHVRKLVMDWRDHPLKTQEWYDTRKAKYEREGMADVFAQEVDRNYSAAVANTVIPMDWITAAIDAHIHVPYIAQAYAEMQAMQTTYWMAGLDVGDSDDGDRNGFSIREWIIWRHAEHWVARDPGITARQAIIACKPYSGRIQCMYDCIGVGSGVKTEYNRLTLDEGVIKQQDIPFVPWNAGSGVLRPFDRIIPDDDESPKNKDFFDNLKAQAWWSLRGRFYKTWKAVKEGVVYPVDELISIDGTMPLLDMICKELAQPTRGQSSRLKMIINKNPAGTKSPNIADSGVEMYFPVPYEENLAVVGSYGH